MNFFARLLATGFFIGYAPVAPGTAASVLALFLYAMIPGTESLVFIPATLALTLLGAWSATKVEVQTGQKDNQIIVIDEIVGVFVTLFLFEKSWPWLILGCALFRFFDIMKITPARRMEAVANGWGVMLDDIVAGVYSLLTLRTIHWIASTI